MLRVKRVYDPPETGDGLRVLVDRLWPRGLKKETAHIDQWRRELAPSDNLRRWFGHEPSRWPEFESRYFRELEEKAAVVTELKDLSEKENVTLLYAAKERLKNNAAALAEYIRQQ